MKSLSVKAASMLFGVSRSTVYAKLRSGELSRRSDKSIDFTEMLRVFGEPSDRQIAHDSTQIMSNLDSLESVHGWTKSHASVHSEQEKQLQARIRQLEDDLSESKQREAWLQGQFEKLTDTVKLLNAPKTEEPKTVITNGKPSLFKRWFK
jgi:septal ring factor EnvC (AmiA/AmiB activator)